MAGVDRRPSSVFSFWLPDDLGDALDARASEEGISRNRLVRDVLTSYAAEPDVPPTEPDRR